MIDYNKIPSPCYVLDESAFRRNLELIKSVKDRAEVEIILAFKAFAMWSVFPIVREYIPYSTASSLAEARLAYEEMGSPAHTYGPAYTDREFPEIVKCSSHITFNSLSQFERFYPQTQFYNVSCGLRINPEFSDVETDLYNPCAPGSRLGVVAGLLGDQLPEGVEGLHFHTLCESSSYDLEKTLTVVEEKFGKYFNQIKWLNMGGGHLMTREGYDIEHLISLLQNFKVRHPHLQLILEPGSAFAWRTGVLVSSVVDVVENKGIKTAMLDVSFSCHMPDCLEMPYKPAIVGATDVAEGKPAYRMGGNSCLSGDYYGSWSFDKELQIGDRIVFEDMIHYTMVKTTMFNGVSHPSIGMWTTNNEFKLIREFGYEDYKNRMS
ncbi:MAG: carboxynorspermidine decarboxylase [Bacteroidetes bacterium]|nr:carboxynorspermidine decarboxylase [Bacteroidota bacterium]